jgi:urease accessory protein
LRKTPSQARARADAAPHPGGSSLDVMRRDAAMMRDTGPTLFTSVRNGEGVRDVMDAIIGAWKVSGAQGKGKSKGKARA